MKHFFRVITEPARAALAAGLLAFALLGGGCSLQAVKDGFSAVVTGVENPAGENTLAGIKASYGLASAGAEAFGKLPLCSRASTFVCRPITTQRIKQYDRQALTAVLDAERFVAANPNVTPQAAFAAARRAIANLKAAAPDPNKR